MFISHINNVIQQISDVEWNCRRKTKGLDKSEYWTWLATITTQDSDGYDVITYPSETFTIVECDDEDVSARLGVLFDYIANDQAEGRVYNIKYYAVKRDAEEIKNIDGDSHNPKQYISSHFVGQDTTKNARLLANEWKSIRDHRTQLFKETDHLALSDQTLSADMITYRQALRDLPTTQSSVTKHSNITWPTKP
jgi:hypothetical protein